MHNKKKTDYISQQKHAYQGRKKFHKGNCLAHQHVDEKLDGFHDTRVGIHLPAVRRLSYIVLFTRITINVVPCVFPENQPQKKI